MSRPATSIEQEPRVIAALALINAHVGKACPTRKEIAEQTGVPRRRVWLFVSRLQERGLVEVETHGAPPAVQRRLRVAGGPWTGWTARVECRGGERVASWQR